MSDRAQEFCQSCEGPSRTECAPTALLLTSLLSALYGQIGPAPNYLEPIPEGPVPVGESRTIYDFIIVGGGTAGCVLASRLTEKRRWKVLLIEAGTEEPRMSLIPGFVRNLRGTGLDWNYRSRPSKAFCKSKKEQRCHIPQGRVLGGTSVINDMAYIRGNSIDFDEWSFDGNDGWSYNQILPYFKYSEGNYNKDVSKNRYFHSTKGPLDVGRYAYKDVRNKVILEALIEMGLNYIDINGRTQLGVTNIQSTSAYGQRVSANVAFVKPIRPIRENLKIITEALATKVLFTNKGEYARAYGVEYLKHGVLYTARTRKEVIISAGAINSPKLLMHSGIGPKDYLSYLGLPVYKDLPVGKNFHDHVSVCMPFMQLPSNLSTRVDFQEKMNHITMYHENRTGPLSTNYQIVAFMMTSFAESRRAPDLQFFFRGVNSNLYYDTMEICIALLTPKSRGEVLLNATDYTFGEPLIYPNYFANLEDMDKLLEGIRIVLNIFNTKVFQVNNIRLVINDEAHEVCGKWRLLSDEFMSCFIRHYTSSLHDYVGTCKMGPPTDIDATVDSQLKVYGTSRLRVVDASIIPTITRGGTAAATIMIAEKACDMIKGSWY